MQKYRRVHRGVSFPIRNSVECASNDSNIENITRTPENNKQQIPSIDLQMSNQNDANRFDEMQNITGNGLGSFGGNEVKQYQGPKPWVYLMKKWKGISQVIALFGIFLLIWATGNANLPGYTTPDSTIVRIAFLFIGAQISGILVTFLRLPDMLGMLFWGVLYTNVGLSSFEGYEKFEAFLREMALVNIMLLAGLGIDLNSFKKVVGMIARLTLIPSAIEVVIIAVLAHFLIQMPWIWGFLLGFVVTAVSPNVVVTVMLKLKEERLGLNKGIHTIIYAMTTCNDVVSIFLFGVVLGVIFSTGTLTQQILQGPVGIAIGVVYGFLFGLFMLYVPSKKSKYVNGLRFMLTVLGGTVSVMGSRAIGYPSAGALGCVTLAFVANEGWLRQTGKENESIHESLDLLWKFLKPISFSLIGKEVDFSVLDPKVIGYGVLLIFIGSLFRLVAAYLSTFGGELDWRERAYVTLSGFPKATVQATLGPVALDSARTMNLVDSIGLANNVLVISVLAILLTAPFGAVLMIRLAPMWLKKCKAHTNFNEAQARRRSGTSGSAQNSAVAETTVVTSFVNTSDHV